MPGAFVFATESERRKSAPLLPHGGKLSSDHLDVTNELPLYNDSGRSPLRGGQSTDELSWGDESGVVDSSEDDIRTSRSRRRNNGETVLSKMYNGLAGMSILGGGNGSRSKSLKRMSETKSSGALPLHAQESSSILPAPQVPFAFMVAKTAKSRASEKDFEDLVVNAKPSVGTIPQVVPRHRHRVKNKQSIDDPVNNPRRASMSNPASYSTSLQDLDDPSASLGRPSSIMGQFSPDSITSSNRLSLGRIPAQLEGTSPNRISLSRPVPIEPHFLVPAAAGMMHTTVDAPAEQLSNPFRPLNANNANPFQPQQRPSSMYQYQTSNPFQPQGLAHDQQHQQHHQQQQPHHQQQQQVNPNYRYSMPLSNVDVIVGGYNLQQPNQPHQQPPESPFKPLPHQPQYQQHQQPQQQPQQQQVQHHHQQQHQPQHQHLYQQNGLHNQASLPNLALYHNTARSTTPFTDAGNLERAQLPRSIPLHDDDGSGGDSGIAGRGRGGGGGGGGEGETSQDEDDSEEDDNETDQDPISNGGRRRRRKKKGEDRYVRGLVRGFGWLVGSSGRDANNVERSDSHGV
ncbi:hypothetical protein BDR26DRAFT_372849 [Obelidium mucronatum]|nr:hypothetical protein BDR26DRAFT_372849 [Obelidium mucronatum]